MAVLWGIDYGKKLSGNTVICEKRDHSVQFFRALRDRDADRFILELAGQNPPKHIFIDAPLTLPGAYYDNNRYGSFFFRQCDQELSAMSPMFLGALTARAIRLKSLLSKMNLHMKEAYPKALARHLKLPQHGYRRGRENIGVCADVIMESSKLMVAKADLLTWHHVDALLALVTAVRYEQKLSYTFGDPDEGLVYL
jgi:predicted nuclease with RNAse H fold